MPYPAGIKWPYAAELSVRFLASGRQLSANVRPTKRSTNSPKMDIGLEWCATTYDDPRAGLVRGVSRGRWLFKEKGDHCLMGGRANECCRKVSPPEAEHGWQ